jgi:hypothetical protein
MNQYVTDGLRVKLAEIQATIRATNQRLKVLEAERLTINRALRLFEPEDAPKSAAALGYPAGAFSRVILDTLRQASEPLSARQIAEKLTESAERPLDKREFGGLLARVREAMPRLSDRLDGELRERTTYWRVKA